jgi:hypothetical protein
VRRVSAKIVVAEFEHRVPYMWERVEKCPM